MGAYLSSPICDKDTIEGSDDRLAFAASSMQGWRMSQEDAHNAILNYDDHTSLFAVYDGHGGAEIALYCSRHLPDFLKQLESYRQGRLSEALTESFLQFDSLLLEPGVKEILRVLADDKEKNGQEDDDDDEDEQMSDDAHNIVLPADINEENHHPDELNAEEAQLLKKEAEVPIEELLKRYSDKTNDQGKHFHTPNIPTRTVSNPLKNNEEKKVTPKSEATIDDTVPSSTTPDSETIKANLVTHGDDTSDRQVAEQEAADAKPSSSEPKTGARKARKSPATTDTTPSSTKSKSKSLTHHLLSENIEELEEEDDDEDEDDYEFEGSDDETSGEEAEDPETGEESAADDDDAEGEGEEETEEEEEEEETEGKSAKSSKAAQMKKLMRKSIMAILNRSLKKKKRGDDSEDDAKENQHEGKENDDDEEDDNDEQEQDEEDEEDEDGDADLGKMLDMSNDPGSSSGCTAVLALLRDKQLYVANAGDSRCVVCRGGRAVEMSFDHKPEDPPEKTRIEKAGYKVTLDGRVSGGLNLSRAIGDHAYKKTSTLPAEEQAITALPDIRTLTLEDQDEFMIIACDGIWNFMSSQDAVNFVRERLEKKSLSQICEELFVHCLAPNTSGDGTGCDNMTAIIVKFNFNHSSAAAASSGKSTELKSTERSPWPTMFAPVNNKRSLSPDPTSTSGNVDENESKKFKNVLENGAAEVTSPSKTTESFSFITATNNMNNNSNADAQH